MKRCGLLVIVGVVVLACAGGMAPAEGEFETVWRGGSGVWTESSAWSRGVPTVGVSVVIGGDGAVVVPEGEFVAGDVEVGNRKGDRAAVVVDGGTVVVRQDSLRIGEYSGSAGSFLLKRGAVHCAMDVFVGGVTATNGRRNRASLVIAGGTFVGRSIVAGEGLGAESRVEIQGSGVEAVEALDRVTLLAERDADGVGGKTTLAFVLDEHGVTPIVVESRWRGLEVSKEAGCRCGLEISLSAVPPREDVPLVMAHAAARGEFAGLKEGAEVTAAFGGKVYRWVLTYKGGAEGHDLVLLNRSEYGAGERVTHVRGVPEWVAPLWWKSPVYPLAIDKGTLAFEGAEGYGAYAAGGRGGVVMGVENLNDAGPGSLRAAVEADGARVVEFHVGGVVMLKSPLVVEHPFLTVDGAGAPGAGILLHGHGMEVRTHDVVLRHFRIRVGDDGVKRDDSGVHYEAGDGEYGLSFTEGASNCIADHLSLSWTTNKILSTTKMSDRITVQWCILSEALNLEGHGYASITGGCRTTWHHNLFAHNFSRNVRFQGAVDADFRNNVIYDWGEKSAYGEFDQLNYVGNYLKAGPSTVQKPRLFHEGTEVVGPGSLFMAGNVMEGNAAATKDNWRGTGFYFVRKGVERAEAFAAPAVVTEEAGVAYGRVLDGAGAVLPVRDGVDLRVVKEVREGGGKIVESVKEAGGWGEFGATLPGK